MMTQERLSTLLYTFVLFRKERVYRKSPAAYIYEHVAQLENLA